MDVLTALFVGRPLNIAAVSVILLLVYMALRFKRPGERRSARWFLRAALAWGIYAAWEWLVLAWTPEADIRVDLLVIWPAIAVFSVWALFRAWVGAGQAS